MDMTAEQLNEYINYLLEIMETGTPIQKINARLEYEQALWKYYSIAK